MGKVTYAPGIQFVQGSLAKPKKIDGHNHGDYLIGTHRTAPTLNPDCTRLYIRKANTYGVNISQSAEASAAREKFAAVSRAVATRMANLTQKAQDLVAFKAQKDDPAGKKTFLSYVWSLEKAKYEQTNP